MNLQQNKFFIRKIELKVRKKNTKIKRVKERVNFFLKSF